jgi:hypothetical protein
VQYFGDVIALQSALAIKAGAWLSPLPAIL